MENPNRGAITARGTTFSGPPHACLMHPVPPKAEGELYFQASIVDSSEKKFTFPRSWHNMCLLRKMYLYSTSSKTNSTHRKLFQRDNVTSFSFRKPKRGWKKTKQNKKTNANCHWQGFMGKVHWTIQEQFKVCSKCLFIKPVGGATPSGSRVQRKIYCSGSLLSSQQVYFYPFTHKTTRA